MVLSNKKLKQKLREDLVKSLSVSVAETNPETIPSLQSQSLRELLDSASHKPRLTKREKRRNNDTSAIEDEAVDGFRDKKAENDVTIEKPEKEKKRKREETVEVELGDKGETTQKKSKREEAVEVKLGDEGTKEGEKTQMKSKKKKKKKKKRKTKKTLKKDDEEKVKEEEIKVDTEIKKEEEGEEDGIVPKKVYVGGIPYQSTEDEIRSYFKSCGVITKVDCMMHPEDGSFIGIAFITFETEEGAKRALGFDRAAMGDRFLTIQQYVKTTPSAPRVRTSSGFAPEMVDGYNRVYVGNLAWDTTEHDIRKLFSDCVINSMRLGKNKETGEFKGYAHVDFKDSVSVSMALKLDQHIISGRPVKICCALKERPVAEISTNPTPVETMEETYAADPALPNEDNYGNYFTQPTVSTGKVKRRSCYECGEKGHLSTACPKKLQIASDQAKMEQETVNTRPAMPSYDLQYDNGGYYRNDTYTVTNEADSVSIATTVSSGKIKRRVCYECGEKGHLSTACPKKLQKTDNNTNSMVDHHNVTAEPVQVRRDTEYNSGYYKVETYATDPIKVATTNGGNEEIIAPVVSNRKIKGRVCYECGEKGHLSSACPKKQQK